MQSAKFEVGDELVIQALTIKIRSGNKDAVTGKQRVVVVWGLNDNLSVSITKYTCVHQKKIIATI